MPRSFDSDTNPTRLTFTENVTCPCCAEPFEGDFVDLSESLSVQDMVDPPVGEHQCPSCSEKFTTAMTGWLFYGEAG